MKRRKHIPTPAASVAVKTLSVVMVVYPDTHILDVADPLDVPTGASLFLVPTKYSVLIDTLDNSFILPLTFIA
ncbi:MAG: hypothetical protein AB8B64_15775 [Granulosicoccus sp.]